MSKSILKGQNVPGTDGTYHGTDWTCPRDRRDAHQGVSCQNSLCLLVFFLSPSKTYHSLQNQYLNCEIFRQFIFVLECNAVTSYLNIPQNYSLIGNDWSGVWLGSACLGVDSSMSLCIQQHYLRHYLTKIPLPNKNSWESSFCYVVDSVT